MNLNLTPTADILEVIVVVLGIIGLPISLIMLAVIQAARRTAYNLPRNGSVLNKVIRQVSIRLTNSDLRNEASRTYKLVCYLVLGVVFLFVPPSTNATLSIVGSVVRAMLISWEVVATMNTLWGFIDYRKNSEDLALVEESHA